MCRHCERLVEDADCKPAVHAFMEMAAEKVNRKLAERGISQRVTANDLDVKVEVTVADETKPLRGGMGGEAVTRLRYKTLNEMHR